MRVGIDQAGQQKLPLAVDPFDWRQWRLDTWRHLADDPVDDQQLHGFAAQRTHVLNQEVV